MESALPELGVGTIWFPELDQLIDASNHLVDFLEVEPTTVTLPDGSGLANETNSLSKLASDPRPIVVHGVSAPVGGTIALESGFAALADASDLVDAPWVSEHLSINRLQYADGSVNPTGFFLPPAQTPDTVEIAAEHLRRLKAATGRAVAFETGVNYLQPQPGEMSDGAFWAAIAEAADCNILCDLHNLWCNETNGRQSIDDTLAELPLERICEIHLAAGHEHEGFMLDAHSGLVEAELMMKATHVVAQLPALRAITFEMMPAYVGIKGIDAVAYRDQLEALQRMWELRGTKYVPGSAQRTRHAATPTIASVWNARSWEAALADCLRPENDDARPTINDPGIDLYRHLVYKLRGGAVISSAPLSFRMLALTTGLDAANEALADYQRATPPALWQLDEGLGFAQHLREVASDVPYLLDVVNFEAAARQVAITGEATEVNFGCDPGPLLDALRNARRPDSLVADPQLVRIEP